VRYFGASSVFSLALTVLARVRSDVKFSLPPIDVPLSTEMEPADFHGSCNCTITKSMVEKSVTLYINSLHKLYPFLDAQLLAADFETYWDIQSNGPDPSALRGQDAHRFFRIKIIAAIASASRARHNASRIACDHGCYLEATKCIAEVTSEVSTDSLRALMLLIVYCLFRPRKGDIWRLLDYACRLCLELGFHTEPDSEVPMAEREQRRNIFWSLYVLERIVCQLFGLPSDFPESIITAEYPTSDLAFTSGEEMESHFAIQHYRLVSIRSRLFSEMYLTEAGASHDMSWYHERLATINTWYIKTQEVVAPVGVGQLTCSVAFHSTILFLFQPLVTQTLRRTQEPSRDQFIPAEVLLSAGRLIQVYESVLRAPRESDLGMYPMTFMSAHHIYMASMMMMAYCIFYLDGHVSFPRMIPNPTYVEETAKIDLDHLLTLSNSCLILLAFCAEKWPGMSGMRDTYRQLSDHILKKVLQMGT